MNTYSFAMFISRQNEHCKSNPVFLIPKILNLGIFNIGLESCHEPRYANGVHPHGELALVGYEYLVHIPHFQAVFLCMLSASLRFMVKLEGEAFALASYLDYWSTNPFQLCHHHLVVIGKAPLFNLGAH